MTDLETHLYAENARLHTLAKRLSNALLTVRPLGGSELFIRSGEGASEDYYADPVYLTQCIKQDHEALHEARKALVELQRKLLHKRS